MWKVIIIILIAACIDGILGNAIGLSYDESNNLFKQGMDEYQHGKYQDALDHFEQSLEMASKLNIIPGIAGNLNNIGEIYRSMGQYDKALLCYKGALEIYKKYNIWQYIAATYGNMGLIYCSLDEYDKALEYHEAALEIYKELDLPQDIARVLKNIGQVYHFIGQYDQAIDYYNQALDIRKKLNIPDGIALSLNDIGGYYYCIGKFDKSREYFEASLKIWKKLDMPQHMSESLSYIGMTYLENKNFKKAERFFKSAEETDAKTGRKELVNWGMVEVCLATGKYEKALELFEGNTVPRFSPPAGLIQYDVSKGRVLQSLGRFREASEIFLKSVSMIEETRQRTKNEKQNFFTSRITFTPRIQSYYGLVSSLSERVLSGEILDNRFNLYGKNIASAAFYFSESTKARVLLEDMAESQRRNFRNDIPAEIIQREQSIIYQLTAINSLWDTAYQSGEIAFKELDKKKKELVAEQNILIKELKQKYPIYAALYYPQPSVPERLPLKNNEVLIEYAIGDNASYLFVVNRLGVKEILRIPFDRITLEAKITAFLKPMNNHQYKNFSVKAAKKLYDILLGEAIKRLKGGENLIIIPDGILGLLPFEMLVMEKGPGVKDSVYVGDRYILSYYQSASVLAFQRTLKHKATDKMLFAIGNPVYNEELGYPPLPDTEDEVKEISKLFNVAPKPPDILLGIRANETELKKAKLDRYKYIHFATHSSLSDKVQGINEPFILLGRSKGDDGFFTLSEALKLRLNADIVVISACNTGRGEMVDGEGMLNFTRAFYHAGAKSMIVSLWEVASSETTEYMTTFYGCLKNGKSKLQAIRIARNKIKEKQPNPFFWAPFILHGEI